MNPWNSLLSSLHSAFIDELIELLPACKPELGMPIKFGDWQLPSIEIYQTLVCSVTMGQSLGVVALVSEVSVPEELNKIAETFLQKVFIRAEADFARRHIEPVFGEVLKSSLVSEKDLFAPIAHHIRTLIWIPFKLVNGRCFLGIGTY